MIIPIAHYMPESIIIAYNLGRAHIKDITMYVFLVSIFQLRLIKTHVYMYMS